MVEVKKGYKMTELGVIPEEWEIKYLREILEITTGSKNTQDKLENGKYPFFVRSQQIEKINSYSYDGEAILTAGDGVGTGKVFHYINGKFDFHQRVYMLSNFNEDINGNYIFRYFSNNFYKRIMMMTAKSSVDSVRMEMISEMKIPIPPLPEQQAIAQALSDTDSLISSLEKLIEKKKNIKQGTMQELLTGRKRVEGFSGEWEEKRLGDIAEIKDGTHQTPKYVKVGVPFYSVESVTKNDFVNTKFISKEEHKLLTKSFKIERNDILMTRIGSIGDCKLVDWEVDASFYVSLALLKINKEVSSNFICHYTKTFSFQKEVDNNSLQSAIPRKINLGPISNIKIIIPKTIEEQSAIANILSDVDKEIEALEQKLDKYKSIKEGMMQELLTGRIRLV